ncbi:MAG: antitoxin YefM [Frankiaceae bacterium]|jgi:prevent-host-death family protein|nr:antitoxin YefM [Frankiaceae bacterium]
MSLADAKAHLSAVVNDVHDTHERVVITRNGRPAAVLISPDDLAALEETLDVLSDTSALTRIEQARLELAAGEGLDVEALGRFLADT